MSAPILDRLAGRLVMRLLAMLARRARKRGDTHEAMHCDLQILVGHSTHVDGWPCINGDVLDVAVRAKALVPTSPVTGNPVSEGDKP